MALTDVGPGLSSEPDLSAGSLQRVLPSFRKWGSVGAQPSRPASEGNGKTLSSPVPRTQPSPCDSAVYLYLFGPSHDVSARLLPLRGRDLYSLRFQFANLLLPAAL